MLRLRSRMIVFLLVLVLPLLHAAAKQANEGSAKISEGWFLHPSLNFEFETRSLDFSHIHQQMARKVHGVFVAQNNGGLGNERIVATSASLGERSTADAEEVLEQAEAGDKNTCSAVIRFQFIYPDGESSICGLSQNGAILLPFFEGGVNRTAVTVDSHSGSAWVATETPVASDSELVFISGAMPSARRPNGGYGSRNLISNTDNPLGSVFVQYFTHST